VKVGAAGESQSRRQVESRESQPRINSASHLETPRPRAHFRSVARFWGWGEFPPAPLSVAQHSAALTKRLGRFALTVLALNAHT
jgi:hypothetical protein